MKHEHYRICQGLRLTFTIVLVVSTIVTFLYGLIALGQRVADWETAFCLAIILGIVLPWIHQHEHKKT